MPKCQTCNAKVARIDAFCGTCGAPLPGGKPVVPIARRSKASGVQAGPDRVHGALPPRQAGATSARAAAVVALSDPESTERPDTGLNRTAIREREPVSEPAPVLPLRNKRNGPATGSQPREREEELSGPLSTPDRDTSLPNIPIPPGPPILASDLLREQMRPSKPGQRTLRRVTVVLSAMGALGTLLMGDAHPLTFASLALLVTMVTLALTPMSYRGRAIALFLMGSIATSVSLWQQTLEGVAPQNIILACVTILLSGSLLFRAYYRGARLARIAVSLGVLTLGAWFFVSGGHAGLVTLEGDWRSWGPASTQMAFGLLGLLSLMAFMESSTRGGSHVWAASLLTLYAVHLGLLIANEIWPAAHAQPHLESSTIVALLTGLVGTIIAGMALAQVLVVSYQAASSRVKDRI